MLVGLFVVFRDGLGGMIKTSPPAYTLNMLTRNFFNYEHAVRPPNA